MAEVMKFEDFKNEGSESGVKVTKSFLTHTYILLSNLENLIIRFIILFTGGRQVQTTG